MVGMIFASAYSLWDNKRYLQVEAKHDGRAPPEARLPTCLIGSIFLPIGLFWFAWTTNPSIHWSVSIIATAPFGFGMVLVFLSVLNYLIDSYVIYAASCLAATTVLRSLFGAAFPMFTTYMYKSLGTQWASSIPAFLSVACVPFPFLFYKYGESIRLKCKYAAEAARVLDRIRGGGTTEEEEEDRVDGNMEVDQEMFRRKSRLQDEPVDEGMTLDGDIENESASIHGIIEGGKEKDEM